jgi:crossover junction endodeoxyribonuclease RusA
MDNLVTHGNSGNEISGISTHFFVAGRPVPQGSLKFINGHAIHVRANDLAVWRATIANCARHAQVNKALEGVEINVIFHMARPKTVKRKEPFKRPDIDKLARAVLDALTGVAYDDDEQVVKLTASKEYAETEGAWIKIIDREKLSRSLNRAEAVIDDYFNAYSD